MFVELRFWCDPEGQNRAFSREGCSKSRSTGCISGYRGRRFDADLRLLPGLSKTHILDLKVSKTKGKPGFFKSCKNEARGGVTRARVIQLKLSELSCMQFIRTRREGLPSSRSAAADLPCFAHTAAVVGVRCVSEGACR